MALLRLPMLRHQFVLRLPMLVASSNVFRGARFQTTLGVPEKASRILSTSAAAACVGLGCWVVTGTSDVAAAASEPPAGGLPGTVYERTFLMIKPDGVRRSLISEIVSRWEKRGFTLVAMKLTTPSLELTQNHYADLKERPFYPGLCDYLSSNGPVVAMVWQGKDVIRTSRQMIGSTDPLKSNPGTVRGDLAVDIGRNVIHGSDCPEGASDEINLWFTSQEIFFRDDSYNFFLYDDRNVRIPPPLPPKAAEAATAA